MNDQAQLLIRAEARKRAPLAAQLDYIRHGYRDSSGIWVPGPFFWVTKYCQTFDEKWTEKRLPSPHREFPVMAYLHWLFTRLLTCKYHFIPKSREMLGSWAVIAYAVWLCQMFPRTRVLVQSQKEDKAAELVKGTFPPGYARTLWERQPIWLRQEFPLSAPIEEQASTKLAWRNESVIQGMAAGAGQVRMFHPTVYIMDEAAHMDQAEYSFGVAYPVAQQIIVLSSTAPGWFGDVTEPQEEAA